MNKSQQKGFQILELTTIITIIMIIIAVGFFSLSHFIKKSRDMKRITDLKAIIFAIQTNKNSFGNDQIFTETVEWGIELPDETKVNSSVFSAIKNSPPTNHFKATNGNQIRFKATPNDNSICLCVSLETYFGNSQNLSDCQINNETFQNRERCIVDRCGFFCQAI